MEQLSKDQAIIEVGKIYDMLRGHISNFESVEYIVISDELYSRCGYDPKEIPNYANYNGVTVCSQYQHDVHVQAKKYMKELNEQE